MEQLGYQDRDVSLLLATESPILRKHRVELGRQRVVMLQFGFDNFQHRLLVHVRSKQTDINWTLRLDCAAQHNKQR